MEIPFCKAPKASEAFMELIGRAYDMWAGDIKKVIEEKELSYVQTFEMDGEKYKIDFTTTSGKFTSIYQGHSKPASFAVGQAPTVFYESMASIMQAIENQVQAAPADNNRTRTQSFLDSLGPARGGAFFEVEIEGVNVGLVYGPWAAKWQFYTAKKDRPLEIHYNNHNWQYDQIYSDYNFTSSPRELLDRVIEAIANPSNWHTVDPVVFLQASQRFKGMFITTRKEEYPAERINGVNVLYVGNCLFIQGISLTIASERSVQMEKYVIDNVEAIAAYIGKSKRPKRNTVEAFFNKNSTLIKKARVLMDSFRSLKKQPLMGFELPGGLQINIDGIDVSLQLRGESAIPAFIVNGETLVWPRLRKEDKPEDEKGAQLLSTVWPQVEKFLQGKKEELDKEINEHCQRIVQKLKIDLAEHLLVAVLESK